MINSRIISLLITVILLNSCSEIKVDKALMNWNRQTADAVDQCTISGVKKEAKQIIKFIQDNHIRDRILNDVAQKNQKSAKILYVIEESFSHNYTHYVAYLRFDSSDRLFQYTYFEENDSLVSNVLSKKLGNYKDVLIYFETWDRPTFICDYENYHTEFYSKIELK